MAERAHPNDPSFRFPLRFRWRKGFIPWLSWHQSPYRKALIWRYHWVKQFCSGCDVLDVPCGMGLGTYMLRGCRSLTGIDISEDAIEEAKQRYGSKVNFRVGSMSSLEFSDSTFDIVCCLEGIEHVTLEEGKSFLAEANRVLRNGGQLFLSSPHCLKGGHSGNQYHVHEYRPEEICSLIEDYFEIEETIVESVDVMVVTYIRARKRKIK